MRTEALKPNKKITVKQGNAREQPMQTADLFGKWKGDMFFDLSPFHLPVMPKADKFQVLAEFTVLGR